MATNTSPQWVRLVLCIEATAQGFCRSGWARRGFPMDGTAEWDRPGGGLGEQSHEHMSLRAKGGTGKRSLAPGGLGERGRRGPGPMYNPGGAPGPGCVGTGVRRGIQRAKRGDKGTLFLLALSQSLMRSHALVEENVLELGKEDLRGARPEAAAFHQPTFFSSSSSSPLPFPGCSTLLASPREKSVSRSHL